MQEGYINKNHLKFVVIKPNPNKFILNACLMKLYNKIGMNHVQHLLHITLYLIQPGSI